MSALPEPVRTAIKDRRLQLRLTQVEASTAGEISPATWNSVEKARSGASGLVRAQICRALGWTVDSIDRLVAGEPPVLADVAEPEPRGDTEEAAMAAVVAELSRFNDELERQRRLIDRLVEAELARREEDRKRQ